MKRFPIRGILPKHETQAASFIAKNPAYNGDGVVIAILDTGVDPGAPHLKETPSGKPKVVDIIDCTGSGDVEMHDAEVCGTLSTPDFEYKQIKGLSGRILTLGNWTNPSGKYKVGLKNLQDLFPKDLTERFNSRRKELFMEIHHQLRTAAKQELINYKGADMDTKFEIKSKCDALDEMAKSYNDPGVNIDCVVFHDGENWRSVLDVSETGDLRLLKPMTDYKTEHHYESFGGDSMMNYSVNIYDEGAILSIVTTAGSHGTHVAAIAAAYCKEEPELSGVAPGAQIVSLKIGDHRLGSMETGTGLVRAAIELSRQKIDIANMSYGEAAAVPNYGRFIELLRDDYINKSGGIFVTSAGNAGPALSTVGAPAGSIHDVIGVGAYVNHEMMEAEYALLDKVTERPYTWSSRGPATDGDVGIDIFAPGAAITSVPQYNLKKSQLMNGTSMSSPNCCGCISLVEFFNQLISGLKKLGIQYTPYKIKAVLINTAKDIQDPMKAGMIQVDDAWNFLTEIVKSYKQHDQQYNVDVRSRNARGVYLREAAESSTLQEIPVTITPKFANEKDNSQNKIKLNVEIKAALECSESWVQIPQYCLITSEGRSMNIRVDPTNLEPGFHFTFIIGYDTENPEMGPLFKIPVTVCKPISPPDGQIVQFKKLEFQSGDIQRKFIQVPSNSNFCEIILSTRGRKTPAKFIIHLLQLQPQSRYSTFESEFSFSLMETGIENETVQYKKIFRVLPGVTLEVCLAQFWSTLGGSSISMDIKFHSILCNASSQTQSISGCTGAAGGELSLNSGFNGFTRLDIFTPMSKQQISSKVTLDKVTKHIRPSEYLISPLKSRDVLINSNQIHELLLSYSIKLDEAMSVFFSLPRFHQVLYDSCLDNFAIYVFDKNKKPVIFQDIYGTAKSLDEGEYTVKVQLTSANASLLNQFKSSILVVACNLPTAVSLPVSRTLGGLGPDSKLKPFDLAKGERTVLWVGEIGTLPKAAKPGDYLKGNLELISNDVKDKLFSVSYAVPTEAKSDELNVGRKLPDKPDLIKYEESVKEFEINQVSKLKTNEAKLTLLKQLQSKYPTDLGRIKQNLELQCEMGRTELEAPVPSLKLAQDRIATATFAIDLIGESDVSNYFGVNHDLSRKNEDELKVNAEMELKKEILGLAYRSLTEAYITTVIFKEQTHLDTNLSFQAVELDAKHVDEILQEFVKVLKKFGQWTSSNPTENGYYLHSYCWYEARLGHYGTCLAKINTFLGNKRNISKFSFVYAKLADEKRSLLSKLDWHLWKKYEDAWKLVNFPGTYCRF